MIYFGQTSKKLSYIYGCIVALLCSFAVALYSHNTANAAIIDWGQANLTYNKDTDSFSVELSMNSVTLIKEEAYLKGLLNKTSSPNVYSGTLTGSYMSTLLGDSATPRKDCSATATLNTTNNANTLNFSNIECGTIDGMEASTADPGSDITIDGKTSTAEDTTIENIACTANFGMSWLTCSLIENIMQVNNTMFKLVRDMLEFPSSKMLAANDSAPVYTMWKVFRNIANTVLLFAFIAIIFSQATSIGLSAYGVKKLLPRVMAFAIMVNLSFFMSQMAVDASNIVGQGINKTIGGAVTKQLSGGISNKPPECPQLDPTDDTSVWQCAMNLSKSKENSNAAAAITVMAWPGAVIAFVVILAVVTMLFILVGFAVLMIRQIIIIAMVILAPVGIAASVLPGTRKFYEFWKNTFLSMLFMFPIISLLVAGSNLIAVILSSVTFFSNSYLSGVAAYLNVGLIMIALVSPWFAIPFIFKTSSGAWSKVTGALDKYTGAKWARDKAGSAAKHAASDRVKNVANVARTRALNSNSSMVRRVAGAGRIARKQARKSNEESLTRAQAGAAATYITNARPGKFSDDQSAAAQQTLDKLDLEKAIRTFTYRMEGDVEKALKQAIENGDYHLANVALESAAEKGDTNTIGSALDKIAAAKKSDGSAKFSDSNMKSLANSMLAKGGQRIDDNDMGVGRKVKDLAKGGADTASARATASSSQSFVQSAIAGKSDSELASHKTFGKIATHIDTSRLEKIMGDERLRSTVKQENVTIVNQEISNRYAPARPPRSPRP